MIAHGSGRVSSALEVSTEVLELSGVAAGYDDRLVITEVDLTVREGELVALVGANGAGKSTLLKVLAGLLRPARGSVRRAAPLREVAYLPQAEELRWDFPLRVEDVLLMGLAPKLGLGRGPSTDDRSHVAAALERVGAGHLQRRRISALSGGERQRVLLARALIAHPRLYLLDEPATGVDPTTEERLMEILQGVAAEGGTVLVATHDLAGVMAHFPRVVCMNGGIVADGPVSILRDDRVLRATYGGHRPGGPAFVADEHHA